MSSIRRKIARLYSTEDSSDLLAALMDTLTVVVATLPLWVAFNTLVDTNYIEAPFSFIALTGLYTYSVMTLAVSYLAIAVMEEYGWRETPRARRSKVLSITTVLAAVSLPIFGVMTLRGTFDLRTGLELFVTLGLICVPAAIRLSSPTAFTALPRRRQVNERLVAASKL